MPQALGASRQGKNLGKKTFGSNQRHSPVIAKDGGRDAGDTLQPSGKTGCTTDGDGPRGCQADLWGLQATQPTSSTNRMLTTYRTDSKLADTCKAQEG